MSTRVLFYYPWALHEAIGARVVLVSYARALVRAGMTVDCFAPMPVSIPREGNGLILGVFERVFSPQSQSALMTTLLEVAGAGCLDPALPSQHGCDGPAMVQAATLASSGDYCLIGIHYARLHPMRQLLPPDVPTVMFTYELDADAAEQEAIVLGAPNEYSVAMEAARLSGFDAVTTVGPEDRDKLREVSPDLPVHSLPVTVEPAPCVPVNPVSPGVLLLMSSSALFHELSLAWFLTHSWPSIKLAHPSVRLVLAGHISATARRFGLESDPQVELLGVVDDPEPVFSRADVFLAPYYYGYGIKLKVLDALARGLPVVTTGPGLSNTGLVPDRDVLVADDGAAFADAVIGLLRRPDRRASLQRAAREFVATRHAPDIADAALQAVVEGVLANPSRNSAPTDPAGLDRLQLVSHLQRAITRALDVTPTTPEPSATSSLAHLGKQLRALLPWIIHHTRASQVQRVAVYGAGSHTTLMLPIWRALGGPPVVSVIVSGTPRETAVCGLRVVPVSEFDPSTVDGVLLSSQGYEGVMAEECARRFPALPVFPVWSPPGAGRSAAVPATSSTIPVGQRHAQTVHR